jgi:hypothetical protein
VFRSLSKVLIHLFLELGVVPQVLTRRAEKPLAYILYVSHVLKGQEAPHVVVVSHFSEVNSIQHRWWDFEMLDELPL